MEITVEMSGKTPREYGGRTKWGVHPVGSPKDYWIDIYYDERPKAGQVFNIGAVKETMSKDGAKVFREAEIIGTSSPEARRPIAQPQQSHHAPLTNNPPAQSTNGSAAPAGQRIDWDYKTTQPAPSNGKIKWWEWVQMTEAAHDLAVRMEPEPGTSPNDHAPAARLAYVNTTLIAYSNGRLELPSAREPGDDDDAYRNPDSVINPWDQK